MRNQISYAVLAFALLGGASAANAQDVPPPAFLAPSGTVVASPDTFVMQPAPAVETVPVKTVETVETVRRPVVHRTVSHRSVRSRPERVVTTTTRRVVTRERVIAPTPAVTAITQPGYTEVVQRPPLTAPLYDVALPPGAPGLAPVPAYRYVYEPDRILVVDPITGIAIQAIPR